MLLYKTFFGFVLEFIIFLQTHFALRFYISCGNFIMVIHTYVHTYQHLHVCNFRLDF